MMIDSRKTLVFKLQAEVYKTLSDSNRLIILHELRGGEKSVGELVSMLGLSQGTISRNLGVLREKGIVIARRQGTFIYYRLASPQIGEAFDVVRSFLERSLANNLTRNREILYSLSI